MTCILDLLFFGRYSLPYPLEQEHQGFVISFERHEEVGAQCWVSLQTSFHLQKDRVTQRQTTCSAIDEFYDFHPVVLRARVSALLAGTPLMHRSINKSLRKFCFIQTV